MSGWGSASSAPAHGHGPRAELAFSSWREAAAVAIHSPTARSAIRRIRLRAQLHRLPRALGRPHDWCGLRAVLAAPRVSGGDGARLPRAVREAHQPTVADAESMIAVVTAPVNWRWSASPWARSQIAELRRGALGGRACTAKSPARSAVKLWIMDRDWGGGPVIDLCCHYFDQSPSSSAATRCVKASGMTLWVPGACAS